MVRTPTTDLRCRCGCLLARVSTPVTVRFDVQAPGIEIRCRRCKAHAVLVPQTLPAPLPATLAPQGAAPDDALRAAE
jgi:hypothetical protein